MTLYEVFLLALALAADAFSVGAVVGLTHLKAEQIFRLSWHFGVFQALMALIGLQAGKMLLGRIAPWDHWAAFVLLCLIGIRMIISALREEKNTKKLDLTRGFALVGLSTAVSIDALAAGIGLSAIAIRPFMAIMIIGIVSTIATLTAMLIAGRIGKWIGKYCGIPAGIVLIILGIRICIIG